MPVPQCHFCGHTNPAGAKFCNECGAPQHLKPCKQCDAINGAAASTCYRCGAADPALDLPRHTAPVLGAETPDLAPVFPSQSIRAAVERRSLPSLAASAWPLVVLLSTIAVSTYYAYQHSVQVKEWVSAARATLAQALDAAPAHPISATIRVPESSGPAASDRTAGVAAVASEMPALPATANEPATVIPTSPVPQGGAVAPGANVANDQTPMPNPSSALLLPQSQVTTSEQPTLAPVAPRGEKKSSTQTKATANKSRKTPAKKTGTTRQPSAAKASTTAEVARTAPGR